MKPQAADPILEIPLPGPVVVAGNGSDGRGAGGPPPGSARTPLFVGPENRLIEAVISSLFSADRGEYFPIVVHGRTGTGKTHLAWGVVHIWRACFPDRPAEYATSTDFGRQLIDALDAQAVEEFRVKWREADLAVIEDLQRIAGKPAIQEELIHTLDALQRAGGAALLSCSTAPAETAGLLPALRSRLEGGLTAALARPAAATRLAVLRHVAGLRGVHLHETAAARLAGGLRTSVPGLLAALTELEMLARMEGGRIDLDRVRHYLARRSKDRPRLPDIAAAAARKFAVRIGDLRSASRRQAVVVARAVAMYLARKLTDQSLQQIGAYFGGRDHTTVIHNCRKVERLLKIDAAMSDVVGKLRQQWEPG
jgi:chromosomal replication initiator protein